VDDTHAPSPTPKSPRSRLISILVQVFGLVVACGALAWVVHLAMEPANKEALRKLKDLTLAQGSRS
jgi:hypothetical protein